jgi:hypothetical protein
MAPSVSHRRLQLRLTTNFGNPSSKLLLALASTAILGSESHGTHDHILLSDGSGRLQVTNRFETAATGLGSSLYDLGADPIENTVSKSFSIVASRVRCRRNRLSRIVNRQLPRSGRFLPASLLCQVPCHIAPSLRLLVRSSP